MSLWGKKFPSLGMCVCICETSWDRCPSPPPLPGGQCGQVWSHASLQWEGSPERPAASDTLDIRLWTVFHKALHSLGQELIFFSQKTCVFQQKFNPWGSNSFTLTSVKMAFWRVMRSYRIPQRLSSAWSPFWLLDLKQKKRKSCFVFRMILTKSCLQMGLDWIFFFHGFFWHVALLPHMMEAAVRPQAMFRRAGPEFEQPAPLSSWPEGGWTWWVGSFSS